MGKAKALILETNPEEANRISRWFEDNDRSAYMKILSDISAEEDIEDQFGIGNRFMEWIDERHSEFGALLGSQGAYHTHVHNFVKLALERNESFVESLYHQKGLFVNGKKRM